MENCIFCKIINREMPSDIIYENEQVIAFKDINPKAEVHVLIVPKKHVANLNEVNDNDKELLAGIFLAAKQIAQQLNLGTQGYKLVLNVGRGAGQVIDHLHLHLLSGAYNRPLNEI
ncbi:MAG TPA: histidine triad nucleotide-binding protein [Candidatus Paceibacterota bacterium]|nr:histidine triad nucleotide-binding protein [Candidatus Paceibacterota bacterium]HOL53823.1 histidine triad nucleotide-binding protein [Candidatus Paceibacterota bacterium]HON21723.1 histidine triad nucleotide-binding protein [Candidatus Paceibacterota bacterium]HOV88627.1 histidine triad nucleotide-binding protein [Candidatus Paceibacterota bacterium]HPP16913.1 histidine triad nucleotide-binding protein [Candidatus Paceibacterota bacterium]